MEEKKEEEDEEQDGSLFFSAGNRAPGAHPYLTSHSPPTEPESELAAEPRWMHGVGGGGPCFSASHANPHRLGSYRAAAAAGSATVRAELRL